MATDSSALQSAVPSAPTFVKVPSIDECSATVLLLHGLGDTSQGMLRLTRTLRTNSELNHVQFILPAAPLRVLTATSQLTSAWFDMFSLDLPVAIPGPGEEDEDGLRQSMSSLEALLAGLIATGIDPSRVVFGGFSQGAATSLVFGLTTETKVAGLFVLSGRLPLRHKMKTMVSPHAPSIPIFWGHGTADPLVTHDLGRACADFVISELGVPPAPKPALSARILHWLGPPPATTVMQPRAPTGLDFHSYFGLKHEVGAEELEELASWLKRALPPLSVSAA
ncbi:lysophospholipase I [Mycena vitilis]|nr:lysophospholipase I [Mycena vitilis]